LDKQAIVPVLLSVFILWAIYRRLRRSVGRQPVQSLRMRYRIGVMLVAGVLVSLGSVADWMLLTALLAGMAGGALLALIGLQHTRFETTADGNFYTPHTYIGLTVSALFVARVVFRLFSLYLHPVTAAPAEPNPFAALQKSPMTLAVFGLLIGYYILFYAGVLRRSRAQAVTVAG